MRKKIREEDLMEDEKIIPPEENNCFAFGEKKCDLLTASKMTKQDKLNCGTTNCPFYKPEEMKNSIKYIEDGQIRFERFEEFEKETGKRLLKMEELKKYEEYSHAEPKEVEEAYFRYVDENKCFEILTLQELKEYTKQKNIDIGNMKKKDSIQLLHQILSM